MQTGGGTDTELEREGNSLSRTKWFVPGSAAAVTPMVSAESDCKYKYLACGLKGVSTEPCVRAPHRDPWHVCRDHRCKGYCN